jgi:hypothetical protein
VKINADERYSDSHCVQPANIQQQATGVTRAFSSALNACTDNSNHDNSEENESKLVSFANKIWQETLRQRGDVPVEGRLEEIIFKSAEMNCKPLCQEKYLRSTSQRCAALHFT